MSDCEILDTDSEDGNFVEMFEYDGEERTTTPVEDTTANLLTCRVCKEVYETEDDLAEHYNTHMKFKCDKCPQVFYKKSFLNRHKTRSHLKSKNLKCPLCEMILRSNYNLRQHLYTHTDDREFACTYEGCSAKFRQINSLNTHKKIHVNANRTECPICHEMVTKLQSHIWSHSEEKPYKCETCGKSFATLSIHATHQFTHTDDRAYKCEQCDKAFKFAGSLIKHRNAIHSNVKHMCDMCEKVFSRKDNMVKHRKMVHRNVLLSNELCECE